MIDSGGKSFSSATHCRGHHGQIATDTATIPIAVSTYRRDRLYVAPAAPIVNFIGASHPSDGTSIAAVINGVSWPVECSRPPAPIRAMEAARIHRASMQTQGRQRKGLKKGSWLRRRHPPEWQEHQGRREEVGVAAGERVHGRRIDNLVRTQAAEQSVRRPPVPRKVAGDEEGASLAQLETSEHAGDDRRSQCDRDPGLNARMVRRSLQPVRRDLGLDVKRCGRSVRPSTYSASEFLTPRFHAGPRPWATAPLGGGAPPGGAIAYVSRGTLSGATALEATWAHRSPAASGGSRGSCRGAGRQTSTFVDSGAVAVPQYDESMRTVPTHSIRPEPNRSSSMRCQPTILRGFVLEVRSQPCWRARAEGERSVESPRPRCRNSLPIATPRQAGVPDRIDQSGSIARQIQNWLRAA